jgi:hypothetical protein
MRQLLFFILLCSSAHAVELPVAKPQKGTIHRWITLPGRR